VRQVFFKQGATGFVHLRPGGCEHLLAIRFRFGRGINFADRETGKSARQSFGDVRCRIGGGEMH